MLLTDGLQPKLLTPTLLVSIEKLPEKARGPLEVLLQPSATTLSIAFVVLGMTLKLMSFLALVVRPLRHRQLFVFRPALARWVLRPSIGPPFPPMQEREMSLALLIQTALLDSLSRLILKWLGRSMGMETAAALSILPLAIELALATPMATSVIALAKLEVGTIRNAMLWARPG